MRHMTKRFLAMLLAVLLALGTAPMAAAEGEGDGPIAVRGSWNGDNISTYDTLEEAAQSLGENKWLTVISDYTLEADFTIPADTALDIADGATLTVPDGVTLTVAEDAKRLGVLAGGTLENSGTVLVCGTSYSSGKVMVVGTADIDSLSVPAGHFLANNGNNYYAGKAEFEITYGDGTVKPADRSSLNLQGASRLTLLDNIDGFAYVFDTTKKMDSDFVFDLGGYIITGSPTAASSVLTVSVPMTIANGTIAYSSDNTNAGAVYASADITIADDVIIEGGVGYGIWTDGYGHTLTVNGEVTSDGEYAITGNGSDEFGGASVEVAECSIVVNDGAVISAPHGIAIYHPQKGTVTISGDNVDCTGPQNAMSDGAAISIVNRGYPGGTPSAEITGGTFTATGAGAQALRAYDYTGNTVEKWDEAGDYVELTGGVYSTDPTPYLKDGYRASQDAEDGTFEIQGLAAIVTASGIDTKYYDIEDAMTAWAVSGGTLTLQRDCETDSSKAEARRYRFTLTNDAVLDLNGHTLTLDHQEEVYKSTYISAEKDLTIRDSGENGALLGYSYQVLQTAFDGTLTINGGEIRNLNDDRGAVNARGPVEMNGGALFGEGYGLSEGRNNVTINRGEINILVQNNGGTVTLGTADGDYTDVRIGTLRLYNDSITVNFNSGIVGTMETSYAPTLNAADSAYFEQSFTSGIPEGKFLQAVTVDGETYYRLVELTEENAAAVITRNGTAKLYADAASAAAAAKAGDTLTLRRDYTGRLTLNVTGSVTIDLGGGTVTDPDGPAIYVTVNGDMDAAAPYQISVKNGSLVSENNAALRVDAVNRAANVVLEDVNASSGEGHPKVDVQDQARIAFTDETDEALLALYGNGFTVSDGESNYFYGIVGGFSAAADAGSPVKLLADYTGSQKLNYTENTGRAVVLDLNGKTYRYTYAAGITAMEFNDPNSNLTIKNGTLISDASYAVYAYQDASNLRLTLDGVELKANGGYGLGVNGSAAGNVTTVKNSSIEASDTGIYYPAIGTLSIENSVISGTKLGVMLKGGTTTISGEGTRISAAADERVPDAYYGGSEGGVTAEGYALYVEGGYTDRDIVVYVNGGTFISDGSAIYRYVAAAEVPVRNIEVSGGSFSSSVREFVVPELKAELIEYGEDAPYSYCTDVDDALTVAEPGDTVNNLEAADPADKVMVTLCYRDGTSEDLTLYLEKGTSITLPTPTRSGYRFNGWYDGITRVRSPYTADEDITLTASWSRPGSSSGSSYVDTSYAVSVPEAANGTVAVSPKRASKGDTVTVTVSPDSGYVLETVTVTDKNGRELELTDKGGGKYTFTMPAGGVEVAAAFMEDNSLLNFFYDVPNDAYYYEAVKWAVGEGITGGTSDSTFEPDGICTRAQAVTFLWRAAGSPEPESTEMPFADVPAGSYYEKAVLWAVENKITSGTTDTTFSPDAACSRGQIVTLLYRSRKSPEVDGTNPFADVPADAYYTDAVLWAVGEGVTSGTSAATFSPDDDCTRAQIVTFLYRALAK